MDNEFDDKILSSFVDELFSQQSFDQQFKLFHGNNSLTIPDARNYYGYLDWVNALPDSETPEWAGLPNNAEKLLKSTEAISMVNKLVSIQGTGDEELAYTGESAEDNKSAWLVDLHQRMPGMLDLLPTQMPMLHRTALSITNPLFRFLERELSIANDLLTIVREDMTQLVEMTGGQAKFTNVIRDIAHDIHADVVPKRWKMYPMAAIGVGEWMLDFKARLEQLSNLVASSDFGKKGVWLGGFFYPEAFMTATRQSTSQAHSWSLDELVLQIEIGHNLSGPDDDGFVMKGLCM